MIIIWKMIFRPIRVRIQFQLFYNRIYKQINIKRDQVKGTKRLNFLLLFTDLTVLHDFQNNVSTIQRDAVWWLHTVVPKMFSITAKDYLSWWARFFLGEGRVAGNIYSGMYGVVVYSIDLVGQLKFNILKFHKSLCQPFITTSS